MSVFDELRKDIDENGIPGNEVALSREQKEMIFREAGIPSNAYNAYLARAIVEFEKDKTFGFSRRAFGRGRHSIEVAVTKAIKDSILDWLQPKPDEEQRKLFRVRAVVEDK